MNLAKAFIFLRRDAAQAITQDKSGSQVDSDDAETANNNHPPCFRTDERYFCTKRCQWAKECKKLIAEWLR
ncbi:MAG: hypothetical protein ACK4JF_01055 [Methylohalobius sp.]